MKTTKKSVQSGKPKENRIQIEISALQTAAFELMLFGERPLITNAWTRKGLQQMLQKHMQIPTVREAKDPFDQFLQSMYRFEDGNYGFPVVAVKEAMASATTDMEGVAKTQIYRNIFVTGRRGFQLGAFCDLKSPIELAELFSPNPPTIREDVVRLAGIGRTPDLRYRAEFFPWALRLNVSYVKDFIRDVHIFNLVAKAGFTIGLGEWRQEKGGSNGGFRVATEEEKKQVARWIKAGPQQPKPMDVAAWLRSLKVSEKDSVQEEKTPRKGKKDNGAPARQGVRA